MNDPHLSPGLSPGPSRGLSRGLSHRLAWFVALWSGGALLTFGVAQALRWFFARIFG